MNIVMERGKHNLAQRIVYGTFEKMEEKQGGHAVEILERAVENTKPRLEVKSRRVGGATYQVPVEVRDIMTPIVLSVDEQTPVRDIADIMMSEHMHRIFITKDEKITGIVTTYDMLKLISDQELTNRCAGNG